MAAMSRLPRDLIDPNRYHGWIDIGTRYADVDSNGHINNVAMATLFEESRVRVLTPMLRTEMAAGVRIVVASIQIDFLAEAHHPDPVRIGLGLFDIGRSSWSFAQLALQHGRAVAAARTTAVGLVDGRAAPVQPPLRAMLDRFRLGEGASAPS
jgi:acyl-CoA thioester hydrolase